MKFLDKSNCSFVYRFYNYILSKGYGIGKAQLNFKDYLYSYLNVHKQYFNTDKTVLSSGTVFLGVILQNNVLIPGAKASKYYINDQEAYNDGVSKLDFYLLAKNNTYGSPFGTPKQLVEDVEI